MLTGRWRSDLAERIRDVLGVDRADANDRPDMSSNIFAQICRAMAVLYDVPFEVQHRGQRTVDALVMEALLEEYSIAAQLQEVQRMTLGLREMLVRVAVEVIDDKAELLHERVALTLWQVYPDLVEAEPSRKILGQPEQVTEWVRVDGVWIGERWDVSTKEGQRVDLDSERQPGSTDLKYPYMDRAGQPILPYVVYHATVTNGLWSPYELAEVVDGTLTVGVHWTFYGHSVLNASWPQRYTIDAEVASDLTPTGRHEVTADPATVIQFRRSAPEAQPTIGQWQPGASPDTVIDSVERYEARLAQFGGMRATDLQRTGEDPRSGYAIALSYEGRKEAARRLSPAFRRSDRLLLSTIARMVNAVLGDTVLPERGWSVVYKALPPTEAEMKARQERLLELLDRKLIDEAEFKRLMEF